MTENRKDILLRAAYDLIKRSSMNHYVKSATDITVFYDDAECDGYCLMEDIATELGLEDDTLPLPITKREPDAIEVHKRNANAAQWRELDEMDAAKAWMDARGAR